jgi:hypothetical protein
LLCCYIHMSHAVFFNTNNDILVPVPSRPHRPL